MNADVARSLGIGPMTLGNCVKKAKDGSGAGGERALNESERAEAERLRKGNAELRMQVEFKKNGGLVRDRREVVFSAIADWADAGKFDVSFMCRQLGVSRSGYYAWRGCGASQRVTTDTELTVVIRELIRGCSASQGCGASTPNWPWSASGCRGSGSGG